jgi:hypothetical protein
MAAENIGFLIPTKIPGYADAADIQAALRVYHYGAYDYDPANTSTAALVSPSIAYTINDLQNQIDAIDSGIQPTILTAKGSLISATAANTPAELVSGTTGMVLTVNSATATGLEWKVPDVTLTNSVTLTSKTLTSPVLGGTTTSASGNIVVKPATNILEVQGDTVSVVGQIQLNCHVNSHGQKIASQPHSESATNTLTLPGGTTIGNSNAVLVSDTGTQTLTNKTLTAPVITLSTNAQTSSYTLVLSDSSKVVEMSNASANTLTIPLNSSAAFPVGSQIIILQTGAGQTTIAGTGGVTVNGTPGLKLRAQFSSATLIKRGTDTWVSLGDLVA